MLYLIDLLVFLSVSTFALGIALLFSERRRQKSEDNYQRARSELQGTDNLIADTWK